jgi:hypothetical protein
MLSLISESVIVGLITLIIGTIIFNMSINKFNKEDKNNVQPKGIKLAFFMTGIIIHIILEFAGFNKWYCNKKFCIKASNIAKLNN